MFIFLVVYIKGDNRSTFRLGAPGGINQENIQEEEEGRREEGRMAKIRGWGMGDGRRRVVTHWWTGKGSDHIVDRLKTGIGKEEEKEERVLEKRMNQG